MQRVLFYGTALIQASQQISISICLYQKAVSMVPIQGQHMFKIAIDVLVLRINKTKMHCTSFKFGHFLFCSLMFVNLDLLP